jgi:WD40 repeat protein
MLLSTGGHRVSVWDTTAKKEVWRSNEVRSRAAVSPDGKRVVLCDSNKFQTVDLASGKTTDWEGVGSVGAVQFTPDSAGLLVGEGGWGVCRYTLGADGKPAGEPRHYQGHSAVVRSIALSADGKRLAAGGADGVVKVWDADSGQELLALTARDRKPVAHLFFAADGRLVAEMEDGPPVVFDGRPR